MVVLTDKSGKAATVLNDEVNDRNIIPIKARQTAIAWRLFCVLELVNNDNIAKNDFEKLKSFFNARFLATTSNEQSLNQFNSVVFISFLLLSIELLW